MNAGERIADFLAFLNESEARYLEAQDEEQHTNAQTQDILHAAEFQWYGDDGGGLMRKLSAVRQTRRQAKKDKEVTAIVVDWITENSKAVRSLERLQGDVQKAIQRVENRAYYPRTDILSDGEIPPDAVLPAAEESPDSEAPLT